jgi:hypothetical protein
LDDEVDGRGGGEKSLRPENLTSLGGSAPSVFNDLQVAAQRACASIQVWLVGYEWWHLLLAAGVILVLACSLADAVGGGHGEGGGQQWADSRQSGRRDGGANRRPDRRHDNRHDIGHDDDYGYADRGGNGGGGLLDGMDQTTTLLVLGGAAYAFYKGLVPIPDFLKNMDFWQGMMLWQLVQPWLFGGRRRGGTGMGGFGFGGMGMMGGGFSPFGGRGMFG